MRSWGSPTSFARSDLPRRREFAGLLEDQAAEVREGRAVGVLRWVPQSRTFQRLRAMQEYLADRNFNADSRRSAIELSGGEKARLVDDARLAVHAQGFLGTGDEEDEADIRVGDNVLDRVEVIVAGSIGNEQSLVVEDLHKAGRVAARRNVGLAGGVRSAKA